MSTTDITSLPFDDTVDFDAAERGFIASGESVIRNDRVQVVWDNGSYTDFLTGDAPETVHPSLWRQSTLVAEQGLFEVGDGIYQVRGDDLSNISFETAAAAWTVDAASRGRRHPVHQEPGDRSPIVRVRPAGPRRAQKPRIRRFCSANSASLSTPRSLRSASLSN